MPELPEVETVVRQLTEVLPGKTIESIEVLREKSLQGQTLQVVKKRIVRVGRKQKIIIFELSDEMVILIHLKMTGQLIFQPVAEKEARRLKIEDRIEQRIVGGHPTADWIHELPSKHTRVIFHFTDGPASRRRTNASRGRSTLFFNDQRVFGWVRVITNDKWQITKKVMAPDVVDEEFTERYLDHVVKTSRRAIKLVILDQDKIGGMGNIYANDALYLAGIMPNMPSNQLKSDAVKKLFLAMKQVMRAGIQAGGASYSHFVNIQGLGGHYQDQFLVYDREGKPCERCGTLIEKFSLGGRGTYFCPQCQR